MIETIDTKYGQFAGYSQDHLFKCLKNGRFFDEAIINWLNTNVKKEWVCVDAGANLGFFSVILSKLCKKVYAFEPQEPIYKLLCNNLFLNHCSNVESKNIALSDKDCNLDFSKQQDGWVGIISDDYNKINSIGSISFEESENGNFKAKRLDSIIDEKIDFIKIDCEGMDIPIIIGSQQIIDKYRPIIIFEYNMNNDNYINSPMMDSLLEILKKYRYKIVQIDEGNWILK